MSEAPHTSSADCEIRPPATRYSLSLISFGRPIFIVSPLVVARILLMRRSVQPTRRDREVRTRELALRVEADGFGQVLRRLLVPHERLGTPLLQLGRNEEAAQHLSEAVR